MPISNFRAALAVGVLSSLTASLVTGAAFAQDAPIQAPINGAPTQPAQPAEPAAPTISIPLAQTKKAAYSDDEIKALGQGPAFPYSLLDEALTPAVAGNGDIDYNKLVNNDALGAFVRAVGLADMSQFPVFDDKDEEGNIVKNRNSELAFWINAYNGLFIHTIVKAYPITNIGQIKDLDTAQTHLVGGKSYSFADMRKAIADIDPRALFVLVDGTRSGPRTPQAALRFSGLGSQLNAGVKSYVDDITRVTVPDRMSNSVTVSPWMQNVDAYFKPKVGRRKWEGIRTVLASYVSQRANRNYFGANDYEVRFFPVSTALNDTVNADTVATNS